MLLRQGLSRRRALAAAGLGLLASGGRAWAEGEEAHVLGAAGAEPGAAAMRRFADGLESVIQGRVRLALDATPAPDGAALLERLRGGQAAFGWVRVAEVQAVAPEIAALSAPFLFTDLQQAFALVDSTRLGPLLNDQFRKNGLEPLGFLDGGALRLAGPALPALSQPQLVAARPGALRAAAFKAVGLEPAPWPQGQPPLAAAGTGLVELRTDDLGAGRQGQGPLAVVDPPHAYDLIAVLASRDRFGDLPLDVRETARTSLQSVVAWQRGAAAEADAAAVAGLRRQGVTVAGLAEDQRHQAHEKVKEAVAAALKNAEPSILDTVLAYAG
jgi:TRAP-type C4-dicarboxylate transport system substrate-binding protein